MRRLGARRSAALVGDAVPTRLGRELDRLAAAVGLDVHERVRLGIEADVQLALLDPLVEPGAAEDQAPQPVDERAIGGTDQIRPAIVHVLAERRGRLADLTVDHQVDQVLAFVLVHEPADEAELAGRLLAALSEVALVEGEPKLAILEHEVLPRAVVPALVHGASASYGGFLHACSA